MRSGRQAFTLIELMIVVVIIAVLMTVVFRLGGLGGDASCRNTTIGRLQKLENALSGYYAAYGSYPPVPVQGTQNIYQEVDDYGIQTEESGNTSLEWKRVNAACRAQYIGAYFPYAEALNDYVIQVSEIMKQMHANNVSGYEQNEFAEGFENAGGANVNGIFGAQIDNNGPYRGARRYASPRWQDCQLFRYGLLSFLLPRYLFMMSGCDKFYTGDYAQWNKYNSQPCDVNNGLPLTWSTIRSKLYKNDGSLNNNVNDRAMIENLPSQRVTARWMPNLQGVVSGGDTFYGIDTSDGTAFGASLSPNNRYIELFAGNGIQYVLNSMTLKDGWGNEYYYYSAPPYQSYRIWSAGPDGKTFPPWLSLDTLPNASDKKTAGQWMADDIIMMSH